MILLKGNIINAVSLKKIEAIENGYMLLDDNGTIINISKDKPKDFSGTFLDYGDKLIMQSFADMHLHAPQYPNVGMGMDLPLLEWLKTYTFKTEAYFSDLNYARKVYKKLAKDLIDYGTTHVVMFSSMHTDSTLILMEELEKAGVTGFVGKVNMDRNGGNNLQEETNESELETLRWLEESKKFKFIKPIITPRFTPSCTNELMKWLGKTANEKNLYVQSHLSESKSEIEWVKSLHPDCQYYWQTYDKYGLWKDHTVMAHCVYSDENERNAIKKANVVVAHCADSNINLCSGICPVREMLDEGVWVTLGSDIAAGSSMAMYNMIVETIKASKVRNIQTNKKFLSIQEAYYLGTTSGHKYFGNHEGFAIGDKLHAIVVDDSSFVMAPEPLNLNERLERAIYNMNKENIVAVWSEGRKVK